MASVGGEHERGFLLLSGRPGRSIRAGPIRCPLKENAWKFQVFPKKSRSLASPRPPALTERPQIGKNHTQTCTAVTMSSRSAELRPGNRRFSPESSGSTPKSHHMGPALTNQTKIGKNEIANINQCRCKVLAAGRCSATMVRPKSRNAHQWSQHPPLIVSLNL